MLKFPVKVNVLGILMISVKISFSSEVSVLDCDIVEDIIYFCVFVEGMVTDDHSIANYLVIIIIHGTICKVLLRNQIWIDVGENFEC